MKTTIVPAQVTNVEDRIAGNLSMLQLVLFGSPLLVDSALYIVLPPSLQVAPYKVILLILLTCLLIVLAIRIRGKVLLSWFVTIGRYILRPRRHLFDKNDLHLRRIRPELKVEEETEVGSITAVSAATRQPTLSIAQTAQVEAWINHPDRSLHIKPSKKGGLDVVITAQAN